MKILYDYPAFTRQRVGGVSRYIAELAQRINRLPDVQARICAPWHINLYLQTLDNEVVQGRYLARVPKQAARLLNLLSGSRFRACAGQFRPDVLHETYYTRTPTTRQPGLCRIVTVHDMIHELYPGYFTGVDATATNKRRAIERADHVICVSENTRRDLLEITGISPHRVSVVYHGHSVTAAKPAGNQDMPPTPFLLYVGVRSGYKNFSSLLQAYASRPAIHREFRLECFGGGPLTRRELRQIRQLGLAENRVTWRSGDDGVMRQLFESAAAFVYPSLYEGFGIPPIDAMALGCPVICSDRGSIPEIVGPAGHYFDPADPDSIAAAIETVLSDPSLVRSLQNAGTERARRYTWENCAAETLSVYRAAC